MDRAARPLTCPAEPQSLGIRHPPHPSLDRWPQKRRKLFRGRAFRRAAMGTLTATRGRHLGIRFIGRLAFRCGPVFRIPVFTAITTTGRLDTRIGGRPVRRTLALVITIFRIRGLLVIQTRGGWRPAPLAPTWLMAPIQPILLVVGAVILMGLEVLGSLTRLASRPRATWTRCPLRLRRLFKSLALAAGRDTKSRPP